MPVHTAFELPTTTVGAAVPLEDDLDLAPARRRGAAGAIGVYVALRVREGRGLFDALAGDFVQARVDEHPFLLDELAADPLVRDAVVGRSKSAAARTARAAA